VNEIAQNVFQISLMPRNGMNCYLIDDVLIDAGIRSSSSTILNKIKTKKVTAHALTHAHSDHQGSSATICKKLSIPFWTSSFEKKNAESGIVTNEYPNSQNLIARFQQKYWAGEGFPVSRILKEGDSVGSFTVIETPGHSLGHLSFFREKDRVLIVGDTMVNMNLLTTLVGLNEPPQIFTTNAELNKKSIKKLYDLRPKVLCFGHGPVLKNEHKLNQFVEKIFS